MPFATDPTTSHAPASPAPGAAPAEAPRPLLSAAVLGLVFEKINGYRDGSFYTPGFVTMYMARHTLGRAVLRHFAQAPALPELAGCDTLDDLQDALALAKRPDRLRYAAHFDTLTVLDPAVGSGHFLVSALNELLALKSRLRLFLDEEGAVLPYTLEVEHDELLVTDADGQPAPYRVSAFDPATGQRTVGAERTRLQRALFQAKRGLMEHALFGVDLNPNSVRICRLRLWIELLKHAYYKPDSGFRELETLPNLDLNVKTGNSLLARFELGADLSEVFKKGGFTLKEYRAASHAYFESRGRDEKARLLGYFRQLKEQFTAVLHKRDKKREDLRKYRNQRLVLETQAQLLPETPRQQEAREFEMRRLELLADKLAADIAAHEQGALFRDAFEWRFEFPEVLDEAGAFRGFDVVLGNPPYIRQEEVSALKPHFKQRFNTFDGKADLYVYFIELGLDLLAPRGELSYIAPNKWLSVGYGASLRRWLQEKYKLVEFVDFGELYVFPLVKAYPAILSVDKRAPTAESVFRAAAIPKPPPPSLDSMAIEHARPVKQATLGDDIWSLADAPDREILSKLKAAGTPLGEYVNGKVYYGIKTGLNLAFVIDAETRSRLIAEHAGSTDIIKPFLAGRDAKRYRQPVAIAYLILLPSGWTREKLGWQRNQRGTYVIPTVTPNFATPWEALLAHYPAVATYLLPFEKAAAVRTDKGNYWWELRACDYYNEFEKPKIIVPTFATRAPYTYDTNGLYSNDKTTIIPTDDLFLLGVLNSSTTDFYFKSIGAKLKDAFFEYKPKYLSQLPIPAATPDEQAAIAALVTQILAAKAADPAADTRAAEAQVDALVAALYGVALPAAV